MGKLKKYFKHLKTIDVFGRKTELTMNKKSHYTTLMGGFCTVVLTTLCVLLFLNFGSNMLYHNNPTVIYAEYFSKIPPTTQFSRENFVFMFGIQNKNFGHFYDETIYKPLVRYRKIDKIAQTDTWVNLTTVRCNESDLPTDPVMKHYFMNAPNAPINNLICVKNLENYDLLGSFDADLYHYMELYIYTCKNSTDSSAPVCKSPEEIKEKMGYYAFYTMDYLIDPEEYENPGKPIGIDFFSPVSIGMIRYTNRYIATTEIKSDDSFLFSSPHVSHTYPTFAQDKETLVIDDTDSGLLVDFLIRKHHNIWTYNRAYKKIQGVLAEIGGFIHILYLILWVISYPIVSKKYYEKIINLIYNFEHDEKREEPPAKENDDSTLKQININNTSQRENIMMTPLGSYAKGKEDNKPQELEKDLFLRRFSKVKQKQPLKTSYWEYLRTIFFPFLPKKHEIENKMKRLKTGKTAIMQKIDIAYILHKFNEIDKIKLLLFNDNQYHLFDYLSKAVITKNAKIELGNGEKSKIFSYETDSVGKAEKMFHAYETIKKQSILSALDSKLINMLDDSVKGILQVFF